MPDVADRIAAGVYFGIDCYHPIKHAALRYALMINQQKLISVEDRALINRMCAKWKFGAALAYYIEHQELWQDSPRAT